MSEKESFLRRNVEGVPKVEPLEKLEKFRKGLEVTLRYLEGISEEEESNLIKEKKEMIGRFYGPEVNPEEAIFKRVFPKWRKEFWEAERRYAQIPQPKTALEQTIIWNSSQAPLKGRIMDGFKQISQIIRDREELNAEGILPLEKTRSEITVVDGEKDTKLAELREWARQLKDIPDEEERIFLIAQKVFKIMGGRLEDIESQIEVANTKKARKKILLGDIKYGVCRHRALLFQVLSPEAEIESQMRKVIIPTTDDIASSLKGSHVDNQAPVENGEILIIDLMHPPGSESKKEFGKYFEELSYQEFKAKGGFPRFGSNRLPFVVYQDMYGRFQGGRLGAPGLKELLKPD